MGSRVVGQTTEDYLYQRSECPHGQNLNFNQPEHCQTLVHMETQRQQLKSGQQNDPKCTKAAVSEVTIPGSFQKYVDVVLRDMA